MSIQDNRRFSHERYSGLAERTFDTLRELARLKGGEYSGDDDRLANFRRNAVDAGVPYELIWRVYAAKHWDAIGQYVRDRVNGTKRERMEGLDGRVDDLIVYLLLFKAMLAETEVDALAMLSEKASMRSPSVLGAGSKPFSAAELYRAAEQYGDAEVDIKARGVPEAK